MSSVLVENRFESQAAAASLATVSKTDVSAGFERDWCDPRCRRHRVFAPNPQHRRPPGQVSSDERCDHKGLRSQRSSDDTCSGGR